jgi:regulator of protease activity HflC (stomatin/prohibitin superfamily)
MPDYTPYLIAVAIVLLYILNSIKILKEYERAVVFRLGRVRHDASGPGIILVFRPIDQIVRVSLRQEAMEVPSQDVITRDNVTLKVNAVIIMRVVDAVKAVIEVSNYVYQTSQFAQTTLRSVLGEVDLDELLAHRDRLNQRIQVIIDGHTAPFGLKVVSVEVKQVDMPENMLRAMAKQAGAERERRAKMQLRYLQTLTEIGVEKNTTIVFPLPMELVNMFNKSIAAIAAPPVLPTAAPDAPKE